MGNINSGISIDSNPGKADWIAKHATAVNAEFAVIERLWCRFKQMGPDKHGVISSKLVSQLYADDIFAKNILKKMLDSDGSITFLAFISVLLSIERTPTQYERITALFRLIYNGKPLPEDLFHRLLFRMYPNMKEDERSALAFQMMSVMDKDKKGSVSEAEFVEFYNSLPQAATLNELLQFEIMPSPHKENLEDINERYRNLANLAPLMESTQAPPPPAKGSKKSKPPSKQPTPAAATSPPEVTRRSEEVTDDTLQGLSEELHRRDWYLLFNQLGYLSDDIAQVASRYPDNRKQQVYEMLSYWRKSSKTANLSSLIQALHQAGMSDIALKLT